MASERPVGRVYRARGLSPHRRRRRRRLFAVLVALAAVVAGVVVARGGGSGGRVIYDRAAAVAYADRWALGTNPVYWHSRTDDCANFVSQCVAAGGLRAFDGAAGTWRPAGTRFPSLGWVNCAAQQLAWTTVGGDLHSPCVVSATTKRPRDWAVGDVVYLGNMTAGVATWEHVIICVARKHGRWLYDSHTVAHKHLPMSKWYPAHFSLIRYCHLADAVSYR
jgi:hypothetical protein